MKNGPARDGAAGASPRLELVRLFAASAFLRRLGAALAAPGPGPIACGGLWGSAGALLVSALAGSAGRTILVACPGADEAEALEEDLSAFCPLGVCGLPAWDVLPGESGEPEMEILTARLGALAALARAAAAADEPAVVVAGAAALLQPVPRPQSLFRAARELGPGGRAERGELLEWLSANGYGRAGSAGSPGEFAVRGGIVDVFPLFAAQPVRLELSDDRVESLRVFDPESQRSTGEELSAVRIPAVERTAAAAGGTVSLLDCLPAGSLVVLVEPEGIREHAELYAAGFTDRPGRRPPSAEDLFARIAKVPHRMELRRIGTGADGELDFGARSLERLSAAEAGGAARELLALTAERERTWVFSETSAERERLATLLAEHGGADRPPGLELVVGRLRGGFDWPAERLAAVSERELLGRYRQLVRARRPSAAPGIPIESLADLAAGEYVVHRTHGIGRFLGLEVLERDGRREEHLNIQYAEGARLYVPASAMDLVARYLAPGGAPPELSRLGSKRWAERTRRAALAARDVAADLLRLAAARAGQPGLVCPPEDEWAASFAASFPYEDTPSQAVAWDAIRGDLESPRPADRLLCGDVGFGKTELAVRAAFKVAAAGRQTAVLVPTTLLAEQHGRTFRERMADYPVRIEVLSRFRSAAEQRKILEGLAAGSADIVVGTHRLLQSDVAFRDLGLIVIDEEQRFGVDHKERLKRLRPAVNVLTLTATPIPRTLHMALLGLRDVSPLSTPPAERRAVRTRAARWSDDLIRRATLRELARDGQVYFVHNRVETIARVAERLSKLVPEARFAVAHGQMSESELDHAMGRFLDRKADVLVSTSIIESGLDIPSVNTIFIDRADRFGVADLHQLRGRVGRARVRAYCYLLVPPDEAIASEGLARVKALEEFSDLGAGWRLAMRDLELRGAGNLLGMEQSGHIAEIGYDLYARMLSRSSRELRGEPVPDEWEVSVSLASAALLPENLLPSSGERLEFYRRLATCASDEEVRALGEDLADRCGRLPEEARRMLREAEIRIRARAARAAFVGRDGRRLAIKFFGRPAREASRALAGPGRADPRFPDDETLTLGLPAGAEGDGDRLLDFARETLDALRVPSPLPSPKGRGVGREGAGSERPIRRP